jgi:hypothetical protein
MKRKGSKESTASNLSALRLVRRIEAYHLTRFRSLSGGQWVYIKQITKREYDRS